MGKRDVTAVCMIALMGLLVGAAGEWIPEAAAQEVVLGPVDGRDLPPTDLDRVTAGDMAPDFTAMSLAGDPITLSAYRGSKNVLLFFYRGHW